MSVSQNPRVGIVIPTYNQANFLKAALESVCAQTIGDWEAVIINNFSDDQTTEVVRSFNEPRFHLVDFGNEGIIAASRNKGIELVEAPWVAFLDSDDIWKPNKLERCLAAAERSGADLISHPEIIVRHGQDIGRTRPAPSGPLSFRKLFFSGNFLSPTGVVVRRSLLLNVGGFNENPDYITVEDFDLWLRLAQYGVVVSTLAEPLAQFTRHDNSATTRIELHLTNGLHAMADHFASMSSTRPLDRLRYRIARSRLIYGAGRNYAEAGKRSEAMRHYWRSIHECPLLIRAYIAAAIVVSR